MCPPRARSCSRNAARHEAAARNGWWVDARGSEDGGGDWAVVERKGEVIHDFGGGAVLEDRGGVVQRWGSGLSHAHRSSATEAYCGTRRGVRSMHLSFGPRTLGCLPTWKQVICVSIFPLTGVICVFGGCLWRWYYGSLLFIRPTSGLTHTHTHNRKLRGPS